MIRYLLALIVVIGLLALIALPAFLHGDSAHAGQAGIQWRARDACLSHGNVQDIAADNGNGATTGWVVVCKDGVIYDLKSDGL
jgi:hypothetical protein